jgi:spore germination protein YaaH
VRRHIDDTVNWDEDDEKVTVTTRDKVVRMNTENLTAFVNGREEVRLDLPVFEENGVIYLPLEFLSDFFQIRVSYDDNNKVVMIDKRATVVETAKVVEKAAVIRLDQNIKAPIVKRYGDIAPTVAVMEDSEVQAVPGTAGNPDTGDSMDPDRSGNPDGSADSDSLPDIEVGDFDMYIFGDYEDWYLARSLDGVIGYIEKKFVDVRRYTDRAASNGQSDSKWTPEEGKISMVWEQVASARGNPNTSEISEMPGLDVVSPTWFSLTDSGGTVESRASAEYISWAHNRGYKVWALFANSMNDIDMTSAFLNDSVSRENAIRALLAYAEMLYLDGINLDFENVYLEDRDALTQFVRELAPMLREQGLVFSVDVNVPDGSDTWSKCYDTPAIASAADYVNLMAYDQHVARSTVAGSVSQRVWVEENLTKLIERDGVPPEKIILGIPFYTRVWEMADGRNAERGGTSSDSSALGMRTSISSVIDSGGEAQWDEESGQFFCIYQKDGNTYHVWLEEQHSVNVRSSLVHKYALAGVSAWSRNFVIEPVWDILNRNLKEIKNYDQWLDEAYVEAPQLEAAE